MHDGIHQVPALRTIHDGTIFNSDLPKENIEVEAFPSSLEGTSGGVSINIYTLTLI